MRSVVGQDFAGCIEHIVIGDDCPSLADNLEQIRGVNPTIIVQNIRRSPGGEYLPARLARLRNYGVDLASGRYIAHLDDDNEFSPDHLSSLVAKLEADKLDVVHSYRRLRHSDGTPYREPSFPWGSSPQEAHEIYQRFVEAGILVPGSDVMGDRMFGALFPEFRVCGTVDTGEWLIPTALHQRLRFPTEFSHTERKHGLMEDNKLLAQFAAAQLKIGTTALPTLIYYLGGYSGFPRSSPRLPMKPHRRLE
ncbi:MAG: hypothetical protein DDT35_01361 [Firmicutes bacterium]|nr:hypothetical protein [Bacillota bacterium]